MNFDKFIEQPKRHYLAIGEFISAFSAVELQLSVLMALIRGHYDRSYYIANSFNISVSVKLKKIGLFIASLPRGERDQVEGKWLIIKRNIEELYLERNHIVHGIGNCTFFENTFTTILDETYEHKLVRHEHSVDSINSLTLRIRHVLTGDNGISGEFFENLKTSIISSEVKKHNVKL